MVKMPTSGREDGTSEHRVREPDKKTVNAAESSWVQSACFSRALVGKHMNASSASTTGRPRHEAEQPELDDVDGHVVEHVLEERVRAEERSADSAAVLAAGGV